MVATSAVVLTTATAAPQPERARVAARAKIKRVSRTISSHIVDQVAGAAHALTGKDQRLDLQTALVAPHVGRG